MKEVARSEEHKSPGAPARTAASKPNPMLARAMALQRAAGNRAAGRVLSRWAAHPDKEQKGVMVPDSSSEEYLHFNPPKNE
jgi:hypothetical protein